VAIAEAGDRVPDLFRGDIGDGASARQVQTAQGRRIEIRESHVRQGGQICLHIDITDRLRIEQALAQAQKVEAIGRLTAGVAHDFNNILAVIMGNLELAEDGISDPEVSGLIEEGLKATRRGAHLTQQLLAFGRRSTLIPRVLDANVAIAGMDQLFRRTLPAYIHVETVLSAGLWKIEIDPVQLETAILNLVINARDAMPEGGNLTIETANVLLDDDYCAEAAGVLTPGPYVRIAVSDSGMGMTKEVAAKAVEPFFTTKPSGKGTGLGLPMVLGFARQSGGNVRVYSEPGRGTSVKLYFPQVEGRAAVQSPTVSRAQSSGAKGCIMVVEDFDDVRNVVVGRLHRMGYDTVEADSGDVAMQMLRAGVQIDLLLADIVMPGKLQGPDLVEAALAEWPGLKAVLMSGYAKRAMENVAVTAGKVAVLTKPISRQDLETAIRRVLGNG